MRSILVLALAAGCTEQLDDGSPWVPVDELTGALAPEVGPAATASAPTCTLRVATWNVHYGADPDALAAAIAGSTEIARADVLFVQEIEAYPTEPATRAARLATALGMTWIYAPARTQGDGTHGIATLTRRPIVAAAIRDLPYFTQPLRPRERNALAVTVDAGGTQVQLVNLHLDVRLGPTDRIRQLHPAANDIDERVVLGGDFNSNPYAWADSLLPLVETEAVVGQDQARVIDDYLLGKQLTGALAPDTATMRAPVLDIRIDNLYARALPLVAAGVEHVAGSDHWPVWADVDICAESM